MIDDFVKASSLEKKPVAETFLDKWVESNCRTEEEKAKEPTFCPDVSTIQFPGDDRVRYCLFRGTGGTCQNFKRSDWNKCLRRR